MKMHRSPVQHCEVELHDCPFFLHCAGTPLPVSETLCGLAGALSATEILPCTLPLATGLKITVMAHESPGAMLPRQLLVSANSELAVTAVTFNVAVPKFAKLKTCGGLGIPGEDVKL